MSAGSTAGDRPLQQRAVVRPRHCVLCPHLHQSLNEHRCSLSVLNAPTNFFVYHSFCLRLPSPCAPWTRCKRAAALRRGEPEPPGSTPATPVATGEEQTSPQKPGRKAKLLSPRVRCCSRTHRSLLTIAVSRRGAPETVLLGTDVRGWGIVAVHASQAWEAHVTHVCICTAPPSPLSSHAAAVARAWVTLPATN